MHAVVLFDGPCTLCNKSVDWIHCRDFYDTFAFASLTSQWAKEHLPEHSKSEDSVVLFLDDQFYIRSKAVLLVGKTTQVECCLITSKEFMISKRDERSTLATQQHVLNSEIGY